MKHFAKEQLVQARRTDLYSFLINNHVSRFRKDGASLHPKDNQSLSIKRGYTGYKDFSTNETGNSVDFLVRHMGYALDEAVFALCGETEATDGRAGTASDITVKPPASFPKPDSGQCKNLFAYLKSRGISVDTIKMLLDMKLIYQDVHKNIVFINQEQNWGELRGTNTYADARCIHRNDCPKFTEGEHHWCKNMDACPEYRKDAFRGMVANAKKDGFWWFQIGESPVEKVYICEASIDAISLYEINRKRHVTENAVYASVGGTAKQPAIDRLKKHAGAILAVDNDEAGEQCRARNPDIRYLIPITKDWNEDLVTNHY